MSRCANYHGSAMRDIIFMGRLTERSIQARIRALEERIAECRQFHPWPALIESFEQDIERLRGRP